MFPLRGLWNKKPDEGDQLIPVEIVWGSYPAGQAVSFSLSGNSPVAFSQIVALTVDNARCGSDVQFIFGDSGFVLQVPAHTQGVFPVFTNGLNFYAVALNAGAADTTAAFVHNSMPPPIAMLPSSVQQTAAVTGFPATNGDHVLLPPNVNGTLINFGFDLAVSVATVQEGALFEIVDGRGTNLWTDFLNVTAPGVITVAVNGLSVRFFGGLLLRIAGSTIGANGSVNLNIYYTVP